jgi:vacuolar-type H+-ATPase subunit I/STV1
VSAILNEANSILYNSVFDDSVHDTAQANALSGLNMASNSSDVSSPSNADLYALLQSISTKLGHMEKKLETLTVLEQKVDTFEKDLNKLWIKLNDTQKLITERVSAMESTVEKLEFVDSKQQSELDQLSKVNSEMRSELTYLQSQSMRNNIIFGGIEESPNERPQDTETKVRTFMVERLKLAQNLVDSMVIERVHRTGVQETDPNRRRNRIIVCKFASFKDREAVRKQGHCLKGTSFFVKEQFPTEVAEKRRKLLPQLRVARDAGKRAWLSYDTLYIDGKPVQQK